jgi:hypothetical protein
LSRPPGSRIRSNTIAKFETAFRGENSWQLNTTVEKWADESLTQPKETSMLWTIIVILVVLWLLGFIGHVGGGLIHLLLVIAVIVFIINLIQGRRS